MNQARITLRNSLRLRVLGLVLGLVFGLFLGLKTGIAASIRKETYLVRHDPRKKRYETIEVTSEQVESTGTVTRLVQRQVRRGSPPADAIPVEGDPDDFHFSLIEPDVDFAIDHYDRRGWGEDFPKKLRKIARDYLHDSLYVTVFDDEGKRLGTIRFIQRPKRRRRTARGVEPLPLPAGVYQLAEGERPAGEPPRAGEWPRPPSALPEAHYLGIELPMRYAHEAKLDERGAVAGYVDEAVEWEVGNFAVDEKLPQELRARALSEIWIQFMRVALGGSWGSQLTGAVFHAYADAKSLRLYLPMGFEHLRAYQLDGEEVFHPPGADRPPPIRKDGIEWWPIAFYPEKLLEFNELASTEGFRSFDADLLRERRREGSDAPGAEADAIEGYANLLDRLEGGDERVAGAASDAIYRLFRAAEIYDEQVRIACPQMDYGSDFRNDPMMLGYRTYCDLQAPWHETLSNLGQVVLPHLRRLADAREPALRARARGLLRRVSRIGLFRGASVRGRAWTSAPVPDPLAERFAALAADPATAPGPAGAAVLGWSRDLAGELARAVTHLVSEMKRRRFTAWMVSGGSAILPYSLVRAAWDLVPGDQPLPPVFAIPPELNRELKGTRGVPPRGYARHLIETRLPLLRPNGARVLLLDDHAYTGVKYARMTGFLQQAGLLSVTAGFVATHADSLANRQRTLRTESTPLAEALREIGALLTSEPEQGERKVAALVGILREELARGAASPDAGCRGPFSRRASAASPDAPGSDGPSRGTPPRG